MPRRRSGYLNDKYSGQHFGARLRELRTRKGISLQRLADDIGVLRNYVSQLESGDKMPSMDTFIRIANILEVTADELLCDYLVAENRTVSAKIQDEIATLNKDQQRHVEELVATEIQYLRSND